MKRTVSTQITVAAALSMLLLVLGAALRSSAQPGAAEAPAGQPSAGSSEAKGARAFHNNPHGDPWDAVIQQNDDTLLSQGRQVFRFETFGDEDFWGGKLHLHEAIEGANQGGVGTGVSPRMALALGLKVDSQALPPTLVQRMKRGAVNLDDPAVTLDLLKRNAVVGLTGFFDSSTNRLTSVGIQCAFCHSTVDNSVAFGVGRRLDGWANHDLDVGSIIASAPDLSPFVQLLSTVTPTITQADLRSVLKSWGPGKFDAELLLDGKAMQPNGQSAATLIPNAGGLAGFNLHTWTGAWGTVSYWNAFVATLEMQGKGNFFDPRLDDASQFPIAAKFKFGHTTIDPDEDRVTKNLPALHFYQLAIPAPKPRPGVDFDPDAAERGDKLFEDKAKCVNCHKEPLWTEPGWNLHTGEEIGIDNFEANRAPDHRYKTMNLAGLFVRELGINMAPANKGRFYHDGRFKTLADVVAHYNATFNLGLTAQEQSDLVEYLKSL